MGHPKTQCTIFAKYLLCREADQRVDDGLRTKVIDHLKSEIKRKSEKGRKRAQLGTVRQLWEDGRTFEEIEHTLLETLPDLQADGHTTTDTEDEE